jgi:hypothetical protein
MTTERLEELRDGARYNAASSFGVSLITHAEVELELIAEIDRLRTAIEDTLLTNMHLADGENCTLIQLKRALRT